MQIRSKILIPIVALLTVFVGITFYYWYYFSTVRNQLNKEIQIAQQVNNLSTQITVLRQQSRLNVLLYLINKDESYIRANEHITQNIDLIYQEIEPHVTTDTGHTLLTEFNNSREETAKERDILITAVNNSDNNEVEKRFQTWNTYEGNNYALLLDFMNYNQRILERANNVYADLLSRIFFFQVLMTMLITVLIGVIYFYLNIIITRPLKQLSHLAQEITKGNFDIKYHSNSNDEIGTLFNNLETMSTKLEKYQKNLIADVRKKEEELRRLKEFEAQKDIFISTASHELKTPVTSLKIFAQLLKREIDKNKHKQYSLHLSKMEEQMNKLTRLITSLLEVARMQVGKMPFDMKFFDLNQCVEEVLYIARNKTKKHKIEIQGKVEKLVYGDKDRISQVIENLLSNAIKYSPNSKTIIINMDNNKTKAAVSVRDFGIGIEKNYHKNIFERFYRVTGTDENTFPGLGIGLYISTEIIKRHKGRLWVKSNKGKGSTFIFTLPLKKRKKSSLNYKKTINTTSPIN